MTRVSAVTVAKSERNETGKLVKRSLGETMIVVLVDMTGRYVCIRENVALFLT